MDNVDKRRGGEKVCILIYKYMYNNITIKFLNSLFSLHGQYYKEI